MPTLYSDRTPARGGIMHIGYCAGCGDFHPDIHPEERAATNLTTGTRLCVDCAMAAAGVQSPADFLVKALADSAGEYADADRAERRAAAEACINLHLDSLAGLDETHRAIITGRVLHRLGLLG